MYYRYDYKAPFLFEDFRCFALNSTKRQLWLRRKNFYSRSEETTQCLVENTTVVHIAATKYYQHCANNTAC